MYARVRLDQNTTKTGPEDSKKDLRVKSRKPLIYKHFGVEGGT
ncbi:hypothetical protein V6C32_10715 [Desulforamulus ruminis]|nr:hypothetical protein [Desulforamulus ruminis]